MRPPRITMAWLRRGAAETPSMRVPARMTVAAGSGGGDWAKAIEAARSGSSAAAVRLMRGSLLPLLLQVRLQLRDPRLGERVAREPLGRPRAVARLLED